MKWCLLCIMILLSRSPADAKQYKRWADADSGIRMKRWSSQDTLAVVAGQVWGADRERPRPLAGAIVVLRSRFGDAVGAIADERGRFRVSIPAGNYGLTFSFVGAGSVNMGVGIGRGDSLYARPWTPESNDKETLPPVGIWPPLAAL